jgi:hypothetical protein
MFLSLGWGDIRFMTTHGIARSERRAWRGVLFGLAVLAQLVLPAIVLRAQAVAGELCVTSDASDPSKGHTHEQQCAHCRLHNCSSLPPPAVSVIAVARIETPAARPWTAVAAAMPGRRAQPPPTGPPAV